MTIKLTTHENEIISYIRQGYSDKRIANVMGNSINTIRGHIKSVRMKIGGESNTRIKVINKFISPIDLSLEKMKNFKLSSRQIEAIVHLARGMSDQEIGHNMGISIETVRGHMKHVRMKMKVVSRLEVVTTLEKLI